MDKEIHLLMLENDRWIAWDDANTYIGTGTTGWAAIGDLVTHCSEYYGIVVRTPTLYPEE